MLQALTCVEAVGAQGAAAAGDPVSRGALSLSSELLLPASACACVGLLAAEGADGAGRASAGASVAGGGPLCRSRGVAAAGCWPSEGWGLMGSRRLCRALRVGRPGRGSPSTCAGPFLSTCTAHDMISNYT